jgi:hypothetical protein
MLLAGIGRRRQPAAALAPGKRPHRAGTWCGAGSTSTPTAHRTAAAERVLAADGRGPGARRVPAGLLVVLPARTHRFLGVLALLVSLVAGAGVLVPLAAVGWDPATVDTGFWFAVAVPVLGLLGALKALLTGPRWR